MYSLIWLADVLRAAGCQVVEEPGWQNKGQGPMGNVRGVLCHDTAGPLIGDAPSLRTVRDGRGPPKPLPGPLSQLFLSRSAVFYVMAAGLCEHAGAGQWQGITQGNHQLIGIEAENAGTAADPWPAGQLAAYAHGVAAILGHLGVDSVMAAGHREYALPRGRKIDPSFDMVAFRARVEAIMNLPAIPADAPDPTRAMLRKGDQGDGVRELQRAIGVGVDGWFGPGTEAGVRKFQTAHGLKADGLVGPATWSALGH